MQGILLVNKPKGPTSFQIIKLLRRVTGEKKIGHTGTLDPEARGLLVVAFGRATKIVSFLQEFKKEYIAKILLGVSTDSDDISGKIIAKKVCTSFPLSIIKETLKTFEGQIKQVPPKFSAVKFHGKRAYDLARCGKDFILKEKDVVIHRIKIIYYSHPYLKILVECSKGTYIRAIARDIGKKLGCYATLFSLLRRAIGRWTVKDALKIDDRIDKEIIAKHIMSISKVLRIPPYEMCNSRYKEILV